jgi:hypothetical protein
MWQGLVAPAGRKVEVGAGFSGITVLNLNSSQVIMHDIAPVGWPCQVTIAADQ